MLNFAKITLPIALPQRRGTPPVIPAGSGNSGPPLSKGAAIRPPSIPKLMVWLKPSGLPPSGDVSNWLDASGNNRTAVWNGDGVRPHVSVGALTGHNVCIMDSGGMQSGTWSPPVSTIDTFTAFGVNQLLNTNAQNLQILFHGSNFTAAGVKIDSGLNLITHSGVPFSNLKVVGANIWFAWVVRFNSSGTILYLNAASFVDSSVANVTGGVDTLDLGESGFGGAVMAAAEQAVWDGDIGATNTAGLLRYARKKYRLRY